MPEVKIIERFSAAHNLKNYRGKCEALHGHNWRVEVIVKRKSLGRDGMVVDFIKLKKRTREVLSLLDHKYLNDLPYFRDKNPTSEHIAAYIYNQLKDILNQQVMLKEIRVWETDTSCAVWP